MRLRIQTTESICRDKLNPPECSVIRSKTNKKDRLVQIREAYTPLKLYTIEVLKLSRLDKNLIVCVVPPTGDLPSKIIDSADTFSNGFRTTSHTVHHRDESASMRQSFGIFISVQGP